MNNFYEQLVSNLTTSECFIDDNDKITSFLELSEHIESFRKIIRQNNIHTLGIFCDNGLHWIVADLACVLENITAIPLPNFFSKEQNNHIIKEAGIHFIYNGKEIYKTQTKEIVHPFSKITFTSGSTGAPKGVCLSNQNIFNTVFSLKESLGVQLESHINVLPYSTLLENIAGIYLPILSKTNIYTKPLKEIGFNAAAGLNTQKMHSFFQSKRAESCILVPGLLSAIYKSYDNNLYDYLQFFRFISVGGGKVNETMLKEMRDRNIHVFEGYGLSECCSVVSLNSYKYEKIGSSGKVLPHVKVFTQNNSIFVEGNSMKGYLNENNDDSIIDTGDLGHLDDEGFLYITGRKKNLIITPFGRNVSPEWVENELGHIRGIRHCVLTGDEENDLHFIYHPESEEDENRISLKIHEKLEDLPEYARPKVLKSSNLEIYMTPNGKINRNKIKETFL